VFGGGATTVAAAEAAQPGETLYPVKIWSENVRLEWENDPQMKFDLALEYTARRAVEIQKLLAADQSVSEQVMTRFENQNQQVLELAAGLPDDQTLAALERIREQAKMQEQAMAQLNVRDQTVQQTRTRIAIMLQTQEQIAQQGLQDLTWLRQQLRMIDRNRFQLNTPTSPTSPNKTGTPTQGNTNSQGESKNPHIIVTPTTGTGFGTGPGVGIDITKTPGLKNGTSTQQPGAGSSTGNPGGTDTSGGSSNPGGTDTSGRSGNPGGTDNSGGGSSGSGGGKP
jgi:hypothetical protein